MPLGEWIATVTLTPTRALRSPRVAAVYWIFTIAAIAYMTLELLLFHRYAEFQPASVFVNPWFKSTRPTVPYATAQDSNAAHYCANASYDWLINAQQQAVVGPFRMQNVSCAFFSDAVAVTVSAQYMGMTTNIFVNNSVPYFVRDLDGVTFLWQVVVWTSDGVRRLNPPATVYDHTGNPYRSIDADNPVFAFTPREMMALAGVDLDFLDDPGTGLPHIRYRNKGAELGLIMEYNNYQNWVFGEELKGRLYFQVFEGLWGQLGPVLSTEVTGSRFGVKVNFIPKGTIGTPQPYRTVMHFISSAVLLSLANVVVLLVAKALAKMDPNGAESVIVAQTVATEDSPSPSSSDATAECKTVGGSNPLADGDEADAATRSHSQSHRERHAAHDSRDITRVEDVTE